MPTTRKISPSTKPEIPASVSLGRISVPLGNTDWGRSHLYLLHPLRYCLRFWGLMENTNMKAMRDIYTLEKEEV